MRITQGELDRYRAQIASRQDDARAYVLARLRSEARGLTVAEAREASIGIMQDCLSVYGDKAQALSAEMFDEICEAEGIDADPGEMFDDVIDSSRLAGKVHYYAGKLVDGDWDGYAGSNADLAAYYVHRSALENMARNCYKNGVRYARVPTGRETCAWCYMLSSRDFAYASDQSAAAASHDGCDCVIVPGVKGVTKIDGYDPDGMKSRMGVIEKHTGLEFGDDRKQMDALTREMQGMDQKWLFKGEGEFSWVPYKVRIARHRNGSPYTDDERRIASEIAKHGTEGSPFKSSELAWTGRGFGAHVRKHGGDFGLNPSIRDDRDRYSAIANEVIDECDALAYGDWPGQFNDMCLFYCMGDTIAIVNANAKTVVSVFRFERGRNEQLTAIWDSVHK